MNGKIARPGKDSVGWTGLDDNSFIVAIMSPQILSIWSDKIRGLNDIDARLDSPADLVIIDMNGPTY